MPKLGDFLPMDLKQVAVQVKQEFDQRVNHERELILRTLPTIPPLCQTKLFTNGHELVITFYTPLTIPLIPSEFGDSLTILLYANKLVTVLEQDRPPQPLITRLTSITGKKFLSFPALVRKPNYNRALLKPLFNIQVVARISQ